MRRRSYPVYMAAHGYAYRRVLMWKLKRKHPSGRRAEQVYRKNEGKGPRRLWLLGKRSAMFREAECKYAREERLALKRKEQP